MVQAWVRKAFDVGSIPAAASPVSRSAGFRSIETVGVITPRIARVDRLRVEDLAERADVSVDTIRFYQKRRLLPAPAREGRVAWYGPEHVERLARIRELAGARSHARADRPGPERRSRRDRRAARGRGRRRRRAARSSSRSPSSRERSGVPAALLEAVAREGLLVPRVHDGDERYTASRRRDRARRAWRCSNRASRSPICSRSRERTTRRPATSPSRRSRCSTATCARRCATSDRSDDEKAEQLVDAFRVLLPAVTALVEHHFRRVLLEVAQEHLESVGEEHELAAVTAEAARRLEGGPDPS